MQIFAASVIATRLERHYFFIEEKLYSIVFPIKAESEDIALEDAKNLAIKKYLPLLQGFKAHQVKVCEVPHDWLIQYSQQFVMPIIKKAP